MRPDAMQGRIMNFLALEESLKQLEHAFQPASGQGG
jgi:hypothetical protein